MAAESARDTVLDHWADKYPAIRSLWLNSWGQFIPFLDYQVEISRVICSINAIRVSEREVPPLHPCQRPFPWASRPP